MERNAPTVSVIIPTHNRSASLRRSLDALRTQTYPFHRFEVVVVADGCYDDTAELVRTYNAPFTLRLVEQPSLGPAKARNVGAAHATGELLLFLDDDIEPVPGMIEAHVQAHSRQSEHVVIGYLPPVFSEPSGFFCIGLRTWWEEKFHAMRQPGHRYTFSDLLSGNFSLRATLFAALDGFNTAFWPHEDYEFGMRLINAGISFTFSDNAIGYHHENATLDRSFLRARDEGRDDVQLGRLYPDLRYVLRLAAFEEEGSLMSRLLRNLAWTWPAVGDTCVTRLRAALDVLERLRLRRPWRHLYALLHAYWYLRGIMDEIGSRRALSNFLQPAPVRPNIDSSIVNVDLRNGLEAAEHYLDTERPAGVHIWYGDIYIGRIPPEPGAERLRGAHLRPRLATDFAIPLLTALAIHDATTATAGVHHATEPFLSLAVEVSYAH